MSHAVQGPPSWMGHAGEFWQNGVHWWREWHITSALLPWEHHEKFSSVAKSCPNLCDPMDGSTPASLSITNSWSLLKLMSTIQPSHPLLSPSPPAFNLSQHQGLFKWVFQTLPYLVNILPLCVYAPHNLSKKPRAVAPHLCACSPLEGVFLLKYFHFSFLISLLCLWIILQWRNGEGNGNPLQCSCLENPRDGGAWWAAVYGVAQSRTRLKWLSSSSEERTLTSPGTIPLQSWMRILAKEVSWNLLWQSLA